MSEKRPSHLKLLAGTARKDRPETTPVPLEVLNPLTDVPPPPLWLPNAHAVNEWMRLAPILIQGKLLNDGSLSCLAQLCALHGKIVQLYAAGETPGASMLGTLRNLHNDFGLSPVAQGKVKQVDAPEPAKPANRFSDRGKRPQNREED